MNQMNKSRWIVTLIAVGGVGVLMLASFFFWPKVNITSAQTVLADQPMTVYFTAPVKPSVKASEFYVTGGNGKKVPAKLSYGSGRASLKVEALQPGDYELHVPNNSFRGWKRTTDSTFSFAVIESVEPVGSIKEIETFFRQAGQQHNRFMRSDIQMESSSEDKASSQGGNTYSQTNQQVEGVDEADLVKTDGQFIYDITNYEQLIITDIRNPRKLVNASITGFDGTFYPRELYVDDNLLVVIGSKQHDQPVTADEAKRMMPTQELSVIRVYDVTDRKQPKLIRETGAEGYIIGTRKIGRHVYMVTNNRPMYWIQNDLPEGEELLPKVFDSADDHSVQPMKIDQVSILPGAMEPSYSVITALDIHSGDKSGVETKAYLGSGEQLYMSKDHVYLIATLYGNQATQGNSEVFKFRLNGTAVNFLQSAQLRGTILNQFSMDEHNGYFRAVTTEGNLWDEKNIAKNHLFILDNQMKQVGSVENLAKNERIYSARFMGDRAYMVTFRETDPLFVLDVEDPQNPEVLGELKIPGFSNYLHPLDERHLLGFGYETVAKKNPQGGEPIIQTQGMKISLFDVTDFANPKEKATEIIGGQGTYSPVQHDHHALFLHPARNLYGFPVTIYREVKGENFLNSEKAGAMIYEISADKGIIEKVDLTEKFSSDYVDWGKEVQRLLYSGDTVYTIAANEIKSYSLDDFTLLDELEKE